MHPLQKKYKSQIEEFVAATKKLGQSGFVTSQGGNLSFRVDDDTVLINAHQSAQGENRIRRCLHHHNEG